MLTSAGLVELLAAVSDGDQGAFERLYAATSAKLHGIVLRILRRADLAEQALEDAYLAIWTTAGRFDPAVATPMTWMVALARARAIALARRRSDLDLLDLPPTLAAGAGAEERPAAREMNDDLRRLFACLGELREGRRRMLLLAYYNGWSRETLAKALDKPISTIRTWLRRSILEIRECVGDDDG